MALLALLLAGAAGGYLAQLLKLPGGAALGAMVLTYAQTRAHAKPGQRATVEARLRGEHARISPLPGPGVFARANSVAVPALLPDGGVAEHSVGTGLEPQEPDEMPRPTGRAQLGSPDAALGTLDPAPLEGDQR